jgi:hypothetical protein
VAETKRVVDLKSLARGYTEQCINVLGGYANSEGVEPDIKLRAVAILLDRGWGRPMQTTENKHEGELNITVRNIMEGRK